MRDIGTSTRNSDTNHVTSVVKWIARCCPFVVYTITPRRKVNHISKFTKRAERRNLKSSGEPDRRNNHATRSLTHWRMNPMAAVQATLPLVDLEHLYPQNLTVSRDALLVIMIRYRKIYPRSQKYIELQIGFGPIQKHGCCRGVSDVKLSHLQFRTTCCSTLKRLTLISFGGNGAQVQQN